MVKVRIHELARELRMENKDLLKFMEKMGLEFKNVHSTLDEADVERIKNQINLSHREGVVEQRVKPTVIRRRVKREDAIPASEAAEKTDEAGAEEAEEVKKPPLPEAPPALPEKPAPAAAKPAPPVVQPPLASEEKRAEVLPPSGEAPEVPAQPVVSSPTQVLPETKPLEKKAAPAEAGPAPEPPPRQPETEKAHRVERVEKAPERPAEPAKVPFKPKKKYEPAKIIERPAVPPPSLIQDFRGASKGPVPTSPKPPVILHPPAPAPFRPGAPARPGPGGPARPGGRPVPGGPARPGMGGPPRPGMGAEERGRRGKKLRKDVQVMEEGKPNRVRIITTKKRGFKEFDFRDDRQSQPFIFERRTSAPRSRMTKPEITTPKAIKRKIRVSEAILVGELAKRMGVKVSEIIKKLMELGLMAGINQAIDADAAALVAADFGYEVEKTGLEIEDLVEEAEEGMDNLQPRPPVVTIMGHVDHGKTSLLDAIRQTNVTAEEAGGITQHIGAYEVEVNGRKVVFLDTPGHEAFTAMRARGAQVTDIVILVVAADDGVMSQTVEAINHAKAANVPLIVAVNKIDKPNANPERVKQNLTEYGLVSEAWGGETIFAEVSAKQKTGLKELLEMILLQAEVLELKANPSRTANGTIIEAQLDKGRGPVATVLVQDGTLQVGDAFVAGTHFGHVRAMINDRGEKIGEAGPSTPVEVIGFSGVPKAGDTFVVAQDERLAKELAMQRLQRQREQELSKTSKVNLEDFYKKMQKGVVKDLNLILKADVQGSIEALSEALKGLSTEAVKVNILHASVGAITESDCMLASASEASILGFNVKVEPSAQALAEQEKIDIRLYDVIYDALNDVRQAMEGLLEPVYEERLLGRAEVRQLFNISRVGVIAGSFVLEGKIVRGAHAHLVRGGKTIYEGSISSLRRLKDDVREVNSGFECGITLGDFRDLQVNDLIETYTIEKGVAQL